MKIPEKFKNIVLKRLFLTIGILGIIRLGTFLPIPGVNHIDLSFYLQNHSVVRNIISTFSSDKKFVIGLFTLNIFPYINASILMQVLTGFVSKFSKLQKEGGLKGRREINRFTRLFTFIFALIQSFSLAFYLKQILFNWNYNLAIEIVFWLTTGAMIILWLSEIITDYGLGNGSSLLIYINIISNFPNIRKTIFSENNPNIIITILFLFISLYGIVFLQEGFRKIKLVSVKQLNQLSIKDSVENYLPLRFNQAGIMPIILTTTILVAPIYLSDLGLLPSVRLGVFEKIFKITYWISYFVLILAFSLFYASVVLNPKDISNQLQQMAVTIPGIRPGIQTTFYLKQVMKRVNLIGAVMLANLVIIPNFVESVLNIRNFNGISSTSLLIVTGVLLDLVREIKNIYYSTVYNNMY